MRNIPLNESSSIMLQTQGEQGFPYEVTWQIFVH